MKLVVLGSGGYYTNEDTHTACYMIPELGIIFDAGNGLFRAPKYVQTNAVNIFLSHAHLDHIEGIRMCNYILGDTCKKNHFLCTSGSCQSGERALQAAI